MENEIELAAVSEGFVIVLSAFLTGFYVIQKMRNKCGNEVIYVSAVTALVYSSKLLSGKSFTWVTIEDGVEVPLGRYFSWLLTCPVLLIHILRVHSCVGKPVPESTQNFIIILDQVVIVFGSYAALSVGTVKWIFFIVALSCGLTLFAQIVNLSIQNYEKFPSESRVLIIAWTGLYLLSWGINPIIWVIGTPGLRLISQSMDITLTSIMDVLSKNLFGFVSWYLRWTYLVGDMNYSGTLVRRTKTKIAHRLSQSLGRSVKKIGLTEQDYERALTTPFNVLLLDKNVLVIKCMRLMCKSMNTNLSVASNVDFAKIMMGLETTDKFDAVIVIPEHHGQEELRELRAFSEYIVQSPYKIPMLGAYFDMNERSEEPGFYIHGIIPRPLDEVSLKNSLLEWRLTATMWRRVSDSVEALGTVKGKEGGSPRNRRDSSGLVDLKAATMSRKSGAFFAQQLMPGFGEQKSEAKKSNIRVQPLPVLDSPRQPSRQVTINQGNIRSQQRQETTRINVSSQPSAGQTVRENVLPKKVNFHFPQ